MDGSGWLWWHGRSSVLVPEFFQALEAKPEIVPVVGTDVVLVEFVEQRLEVTQAADGILSGVVAPGGVFADAAEQDGTLD